ncbi:hypothetical protein A2U01_0100170, partial [Trifolium medium]|nr:hypothetical protein [Trifolium medium]
GSAIVFLLVQAAAVVARLRCCLPLPIRPKGPPFGYQLVLHSF